MDQRHHDNHHRSANHVPSPRPGNSPSKVSIRTLALHPDQVDDRLIEAWRELEENALQPNAFLSPNFVLPAKKYLLPDESTEIILVERKSPAGTSLIGAGVFSARQPIRLIPFVHRDAFRSTHSFATGLLIDRQYSTEAIEAIFCHLLKCSWGTLIKIGYQEIPTENEQFFLIQEIAKHHNLSWHEYESYHRATLNPQDVGQPYIDKKLKALQKDMNRCKRRLEEIDKTTWRFLDGNSAENLEKSIQIFLDLEHMGWKGEAKGSMKSCKNQEAFFIEMATSFLQEKRCFFTEILLGEKVIASTFNLISGNSGFAFKIARDPAYAKMSVGIINELELVRHAPTLIGSLPHMDSCTTRNSFMEKIWPNKMRISSGFFISNTATPLVKSLSYLKKNKNNIRNFFGRIVSLVTLTISEFHMAVGLYSAEANILMISL